MYSDNIIINENYQSSVNLELDLDNERKIKEYIPTRDICDVIKTYALSVLNKTKERSTVLVGPYGKGKSFILLVISFLFGNGKESKTWSELVNKIKKVDSELYELLIEIKDKKINLLPVLINSNYENIGQSLQLALNNALRRVGKEELIPDNAFKLCEQLYEKWSSDILIKNAVVKKCIEVNHIDEREMISGLKELSYKAYSDFKKIYFCVNGLEFNPLINADVVKMYLDVAGKLHKQGYSGMFIIFDEFSKFIESTSSNLMHDLKVIQDLAEACVRSGTDSQLHLCCVTHKPLSLYGNKTKNVNYIDSFKTVEGRFVEIRFNRSLEDNYEIISGAIKKNAIAFKDANNFVDSNDCFYRNVDELNLFNSYSNKKLYTGCYPLNPVTLYCLIQLSEIVAQNERTLFTFLSDADENSFNSFIHKNDIGLFNTDKIYDYFNGLLQKEEQNQIRNIWYRSETLLNKTTDPTTKSVIKSLAIILMLNDFEKMPSTVEIIAMNAGVDVSKTKDILEEMIENHYLRRNLLNNMISFALSSSKKIDENVEYLSKTKFKTIDYAATLNSINEKRFVLPRRYNEQNKITRFYSVLFLNENEFFNLCNFDYYLKNTYCDGIVFNLLNFGASPESIVKKVYEINADNVIVRFPSKSIDSVLSDLITRHVCLNEIRKQKNIDEITENELDLLIQETRSDIATLIDSYFSDDVIFINSLVKETSFNNMLSTIMEHIYSKKLVFNNELINKRNVSSQYQKAANHVIDYYLQDLSWEFSETSPENSIKTSIITNNENSLEFRLLINEIKNAFLETNGRKTLIEPIVSKYRSRPYGLREGVLPVIMAKAISELSENIILYFQNKEIELTSINLVKAILNPKYFISSTKSSKEKADYLTKMLALYKVVPTNNYNKDIVSLSEKMKRFFVGLPQVLRVSSLKDNFLELPNSFIDYKNVFVGFNINPSEAIFELPIKIFGTSDFSRLYIENKMIVDDSLKLINPFKRKMVATTKELFGFGESTSLKMGIQTWISSYCPNGNVPLLDSQNKKIFNSIVEQQSFDEYEFVGVLLQSAVGNYVEDWDKDNTDEYISAIEKFKEEIRNVQLVDKEDAVSQLLGSKTIVELSPMGDLLKNSIESVLEEFSNSVSETEKLSILSEIIKNSIK